MINASQIENDIRERFEKVFTMRLHGRFGKYIHDDTRRKILKKTSLSWPCNAKKTTNIACRQTKAILISK